MEVWTDGTLVVQACEKTSALRVLRDFTVVGESKTEHDLGWKTPLAVDVDADRIWAGNHLHEFRLSDLSPVATYQDKVWRVAGLGSGRLAAILPPIDGVCRLAVGQPGRWEREVVLDNLGEAAPGLAATNDQPISRAVGHGGDPTLTVTEHGLVVADGTAGVVAHFTPDLELLGLWHAGGTDETELTGYATARGVLVTARWAARDSHVGWLTPDGPEHLRDGHRAFALPAGDDRFWLVDDYFGMALVDHDGETLASAPPRGFVNAAHASGPWCAIGSTSSVCIAAAADDGIAVRTVSVGGLVNIIGIFPPDVDKNELHQSHGSAISRHSVKHGYNMHYDEDNQLHVLVQEVQPDAKSDVAQILRAAGATHVDIGDPIGNPLCSGCRRRQSR